jgi:hypothetical protein
MNPMIRSFAFVVLCACTGGGGPIPDAPDIERPPSTFERPNQRARTGVASQNDDEKDAPQTTIPSAGGTLDCSGRYTCREAGSATTSTITLDNASGQCRFETFVLEADGRVTSGTNPVGTWVVTSSGLTISASGRTLTCTK